MSDFVYATAVSSCDIHEGHVWILFAILSEQAPGTRQWFEVNRSY